MREIVSDVFTWSWFSDPHGYNFNGYLIRRAEGNLCIDPAEPGDDDQDEIACAGVARILLTIATTDGQPTGSGADRRADGHPSR